MFRKIFIVQEKGLNLRLCLPRTLTLAGHLFTAPPSSPSPSAMLSAQDIKFQGGTSTGCLPLFQEEDGAARCLSVFLLPFHPAGTFTPPSLSKALAFLTQPHRFPSPPSPQLGRGALSSFNHRKQERVPLEILCF